MKKMWVLIFVGGIVAGWLVGAVASADDATADFENTVKAHAKQQHDACKEYEMKVANLVQDTEASPTHKIVAEKDVSAALELLKSTPRISDEDDKLRARALHAYSTSLDPKKAELLMPYDRCVMGYNKLAQGLIGALSKKNNPQTASAIYDSLKSFIEDKKQKEVISFMVDLNLLTQMTRNKLVKAKSEQEKNLEKLTADARAWTKELMVKTDAATDEIRKAMAREEKETPIWRDKLVRAFEELKK